MANEPINPLRKRGKRHNRVTPRDHTFRAFTQYEKDTHQAYHQGYGESDTNRACHSHLWFDKSDIVETVKDHIVPRQSLTQRQHLTLFGKPTLLRRGEPFKLPILKRETSKTHKIRVDEDATLPQSFDRPNRHGSVKVFSEIEVDRINKERGIK